MQVPLLASDNGERKKKGNRRRLSQSSSKLYEMLPRKESSTALSETIFEMLICEQLDQQRSLHARRRHV